MTVIVSFIVVSLVQLQSKLNLFENKTTNEDVKKSVATAKPKTTTPPELVSVTLRVKTHFTNLSDQDEIFVASEMSDWEPNQVQLEKVKLNEYEVTFHMRKGKSMEYKFTLGSWDSSEVSKYGEEVPNHVIKPLFTEQTEVVYVDGWKNKTKKVKK